MARGCLELLLLWAVTAFGLYTYYHGRFEPPGYLYGALGGGFAIACAWGLLRNSFLAFKQRRLVSATTRGSRPEDGRVFAAVGRARALGSPLVTPF
ncbi:MAG: hypothetical protein KDD69_00945 [Bdellovibrionales bacterium]|nr:hypothetical protein [Bdellovibrionales bacterium]